MMAEKEATDSKQQKAIQWIEDEGIEDLSGNPIEVDKNGMVTLYHRTSKESANQMNKTGKFISKENTDETFFSNKPTGQAEGYGDSIIGIKVPAQDIRIDDAFRDEIHVAVSNKKIDLHSIITPANIPELSNPECQPCTCQLSDNDIEKLAEALASKIKGKE